MPDDLTAMLRREIAAHFGLSMYPPAVDALAARLAAAAWRWATSATDPADDLSGMVFRQEKARLEAVRERDAVRRELAELEAEVQEMVKHPEYLRPELKAIARALASREEQPHA